MILGLIPARGGSQSIPRKNIKLLGGKPLIQWTIEAARASGVIDRLVVSTEDDEIARASTRCGAIVLARPLALARDETAMRDVIMHALCAMGPDVKETDIVVLLQPTSPFREPEWIKDAVAELRNPQHRGLDATVTVIKVPRRFAPEQVLKLDGLGRLEKPRFPKRRQDMLDVVVRDGSVYAFRVGSFLGTGSIYGRCCSTILVDETPNLDEPEDWAEAERRVASMLVTA